MAVSADDYLTAMQGLLPPGAAWSKDADAYTTRLLTGLAQEMARVDGRATQLVEESDTRTTSELFADWERVTGLPDACVTAFAGTQTVAQRRAALVGRITTLGGQSAAYFVALAANLGYAITVTEFAPHTANADVDQAITGDNWAFAWQINTALNTVIEFNAESTADEPLAAWGNSLLECVINRLKPAQSSLIFSYT